MSHEIRTPINAVLGMNEMILRESESDEVLEYATNIQSAGRTLLTLINSILDFSKIEDGKMEIVPVRYETVALIDDLVNMILDKAQKKGLEFRTEISSDLPRSLYGDDVRIRQVITNILTNAVKYTHAGHVALKIDGAEIDADTFELSVEVSDTGIGIRAEDMSKLFQSFQRLDEERNRNIDGTGLGIAIVQKLLAMMDSRLEVDSVYGSGSTFSFKLTQKIIDKNPIGDYSASHLRHFDKAAQKKFLLAEGAKILVVDDNDMNLKVISGLLKRNKIVPDLAESGQQGIELARKNFYHGERDSGNARKISAGRFQRLSFKANRSREAGSDAGETFAAGTGLVPGRKAAQNNSRRAFKNCERRLYGRAGKISADVRSAGRGNFNRGRQRNEPARSEETAGGDADKNRHGGERRNLP